ncbi:MAG: phospholipase D-like domain-containing protein [archaeon]|nr:phospholipase D-like domain-containing protein [archaeon]
MKTFFGGKTSGSKEGPSSSSSSSSSSPSSNSGSAPNSTTDHVFIDASKHSSLIGPKGATLHGLKDKHQVMVEVPKKESGSTRVSIVGPADRRKACLKEMEGIVGYPLIPNTPLSTADVAIPSTSHAALIGKGGANIKKLQRDGCSVDIPGKDAGAGAKVRFTGYPAVLENALKEARELVGPTNFNVTSTNAGVGEEELDFQPLPLDGRIVEALFFPETEEGPNFRRFLHYLVSAKVSLEVCVFTITDDRISQALIAAHHRGVRVRVITDDDQAQALGSDIEEFRHQGIQVREDKSKFHMHHKFAIVDHKVLINGSYNWTRNANLCNNENITILSEAALLKSFTAEFERLWLQFK